MSDRSIDVRAATAAGFEALKRNDTESARESFARAVAAGGADAEAWYGLSQVHRRLGATSEESAALDRVLKLDGRNLPALIAKGDLNARMGDTRAATSYYSAVVKLAASLTSPSPQLRSELARIDAALEGFKRNYEAHLLRALAQHGLGEAGTERFAHAIDLLLGKRLVYVQQPKYFFFPELPQIQFYDKRTFPWAESLEGKTKAIEAEVRALLTTEAGFEPYVQASANRPVFDPRGLLNNPDWVAYYLIRNGVDVAENAARCPNTLAAVRELPLCRIDGRTPSVHFSLLRPGAHIPPHHGFTNARLICHLPLIVPTGCALRVGNETRSWRPGELVVFDDSIEHEAWNNSAELRVVLLFDVWRPELSAKERELVAAMLGSIDHFQGSRQEWTE
jgi:aspartate beta-hydroxylase